jgi:putative glutamine amidotransferase
MSAPLKLAISTWNKGAYRDIQTWLSSFHNNIAFIELSAEDDPQAVLRSCSGLILPGGGDPDPALYDTKDPEGLCDVDRARDDFEIGLIYTALQHGLPILGICRGFQIMNVALGGSLILDLPTVGISGHQVSTSSHPNIHIPDRSTTPHSRESGNLRLNQEAARRGEATDAQHPITISKNSLLHKITGLNSAIVNSNHHQGIDKIADCLSASAVAPDGVIEALEWNPDFLERLPGPPYKLSISSGNASGNYQLSIANFPFLLLLHWHPERMPGDACSETLANAFLRSSITAH